MADQETVEQSPDRPMGLPCVNCGHDFSDHKTSTNSLGYRCVVFPCPCPFFVG